MQMKEKRKDQMWRGREKERKGTYETEKEEKRYHEDRISTRLTPEHAG